MIETLRFNLAPGVSDEDFLTADKAVQTEFAYQQPGLLRRTTAQGDDGAWIVIDLWTTPEAAAACNERWGQDPVTAGFMKLVEPASVRVERYTELPG